MAVCCWLVPSVCCLQVNEVWAGLGYYRRARYLLEGAQYVVNKLDGQFPETAAGVSA
jgi:A/G-specific adenine glycosylase